MAQLRGPGSMTGVNLLAKVYDNGVTKDGKFRFVDAQIDARDQRGPAQTNLHLTSQRVTDKDGKTRYNNGAAYSTGQFEEIVKAAESFTGQYLARMLPRSAAAKKRA